MMLKKRVFFVFLALFSLFTGSFTATLVVGKMATVSAAPAVKPDMRVSKTFTINQGYSCQTPTEQASGAGNEAGDLYCIVDSFPLSTPPVAMDCLWTTNDPLFHPGAWRQCRIAFVASLNAYVNVIWNNQQVELLVNDMRNNNPSSAPASTTIVYSAVT